MYCMSFWFSVFSSNNGYSVCFRPQMGDFYLKMYQNVSWTQVKRMASSVNRQRL